jgi:hypothetical protein
LSTEDAQASFRAPSQRHKRLRPGLQYPGKDCSLSANAGQLPETPFSAPAFEAFLGKSGNSRDWRSDRKNDMAGFFSITTGDPWPFARRSRLRHWI